MGFSRERPGPGGKIRYAAIYRDLKRRQRSAGTFATKRQAEARQRAEFRHAGRGPGSATPAGGARPSAATWNRMCGCLTTRWSRAPGRGIPTR